MNTKRQWKTSAVVGILAVTACVSSLLFAETPKVPAELKPGEVKFNANCARCHGALGVGTSVGPPLVHKVYEPNHHGDAAFQRAAALGVRAHHWQFGDMPKIPTVTSTDVDEIVRYIRWLQRQAGIF